MRHLRYSLICAFLFALLLLPAEACECDLEVLEIEHASKFADVIFIGIVYDINDIDEKGRKVITLRVLKSWKKPLPDIINITTSADDLDCGYSFYMFETYLVYASGYYDKELITGTCTRTHPIYDDDEDLKYIHKLFKGY